MDFIVSKNKNMKYDRIKMIILLHIMLLVYSLNGICSKLAAGEDFMSLRFCLYYFAELLLLGIYAIAWQQIIKRLPLTLAYANKAVTIVWGILWGAVFFDEDITIGKIIGAVIVIAGVILFAYADKEDISE